MAEPVTLTAGQKAADAFQQFLESELNDGERWMENGQLNRLNTEELKSLQERYSALLSEVPGTLDRSVFRNRVAQLLGNHSGSESERTRVRTLSTRLEGAFQTTALGGGVQLNAQSAAPVPTGLDLSQVTDAASAMEVFNAVLGTHIADETQWTVKVNAGEPNAIYNGDRVKITGPETNRLKQLTTELFARLSPMEAAAFRRQAVAALEAAPTNGYERDVKYRDIVKHLERAFQSATAAKPK